MIGLAPRICKHCLKSYTPTARGQKYCGKQKLRGTCSWEVAQAVTKKWLAENPTKAAEYQRKTQQNIAADPIRNAKEQDRRRRKDLKRHGMTVEQYDAKFLEQKGLCAICWQPHGGALSGRSKNLAVDHDHTNGQLRGLLCDDCNTGLGLFRDSPQRLYTAGSYIFMYSYRDDKLQDSCHHGMTPEQYDAKFAEQNGVCIICLAAHGRMLFGRYKRLAVDHDHVSGQLRGLLCDDCNMGLGLFRDDPQRLFNAGLYIFKHKELGNQPIPTLTVHTAQDRIDARNAALRRLEVVVEPGAKL